MASHTALRGPRCGQIAGRSRPLPSRLRSSLRSPPIRAQAATAQPETITERVFRELESKSAADGGAGGAGGATTYADLKRVDAAWHDLRTKQVYGLAPQFVRCTNDPLPAEPALDVIIAGGTLGIFLGAALQRAGLRVAVVERGPLKGRSQEWNLSRKELAELVAAGAIDADDADAAVATEFNPVRAGFHGYEDVWTTDILNIGVSPVKLVAGARRAFEAAGGLVVERAPLSGVWVHPNGVQVRGEGDAAKGQPSFAVAAKLLVDCMGHASPIVRQIRHGQRPDGICMVVGTCARGFDPEKNKTGDVIVTAAPSESPSGSNSELTNMQMFWEAFPSGSGPSDRTTYMFSYLDADASRPSLEAMLEHYYHAMPAYQGVNLDDLEVLRVLFGVFPTYRDSPLPPEFNRVLAVGDASGIQSPLSFGGLAAMARHLERMKGAIVEAISANALDRYSLKYINPYNPSLSAAWMMQRAMSIPADLKSYDRAFINRLLGGNFQAMRSAGDATLRPFLQDVLKPGPLGRTLLGQIAADPLFVFAIFQRVGFLPLVDWLQHYIGMAAYAGAYKLAKERLEEKASKAAPKRRYLLRRALERWRFGSGSDYDPGE
jgi:flavin-dependent dehydrogenase